VALEEGMNELKEKYAIGDKCYCDFELGRVERLDNEKVTGVRLAGIKLVGGRLKCFPPSDSVKQISDIYKRWQGRLHDEGIGSLNYPDMHSWLLEHWERTCEEANDNDFGWRTKRYDEVKEFSLEILDKCKELRELVLKSGIRFLR